MKDYVYIIEFGVRLVKIGRSAKPETRIRNISSASGRKHLRTWVSPPVKDAGALEKLAHAALSELRGHGEWFDCGFEDAVSRVSPLLTKDMAWNLEWEEIRKAEQKLGAEALIRALFPSALGSLKSSDEDKFIHQLKTGLFERAIRNYMSFIAVDLQREQILGEKILSEEFRVESLDGMTSDQFCELVFLRAVSNEEFLSATMVSGIYLGHVTENCMMILGDTKKIPEMIDVVERLARERLDAGEPAP